MESTVLEPQTSKDTTRPVVNHYAPKAEITESLIFGTPVTALCGHQYVANGQGGGHTARKGHGAVICHMCAHIYSGMGPGGDE